MRILLAVAALGQFVLPAFSGDVIEFVPPPDMSQAFDWSGAYVGVQAGYSFGNGSASNSLVGASASPNPDGFLGGFYAGYNFLPAPNLMVGLDADFAWSGAEDSADVSFTSMVLPVTPIVYQNVDWTAAIRARLGYPVDRWLPYVAGGVAFAKVTQNTNAAPDSYDKTYTGWTLGAGFDYAVTDNLVFRTEYRFSDYGRANFADSTQWQLKSHDLRIGVSYKF